MGPRPAHAFGLRGGETRGEYRIYSFTAPVMAET
jgi:hypothetical protein